MPFVKMDVAKKVNERMANDPQFREAYLEARREYKLIKETTKIRKKLEYSQQYVAEKIGVKQQVVSRIETIENSPTLDNFLKYVDALDLEVKLEKKSTNLKEKNLVSV
jgi:HTH-type transcriptional regulator/antitoxin HipB